MTTTSIPTGEHCESCGATDYESLHTGDQGYTACCNELICSGGANHVFGTTENNVRACCWAVAEIKFGGADQVPDHGSRLR